MTTQEFFRYIHFTIGYICMMWGATRNPSSAKPDTTDRSARQTVILERGNYRAELTAYYVWRDGAWDVNMVCTYNSLEMTGFQALRQWAAFWNEAAQLGAALESLYRAQLEQWGDLMEANKARAELEGKYVEAMGTILRTMYAATVPQLNLIGDMLWAVARDQGTPHYTQHAATNAQTVRSLQLLITRGVLDIHTRTQTTAGEIAVYIFNPECLQSLREAMEDVRNTHPASPVTTDHPDVG